MFPVFAGSRAAVPSLAAAPAAVVADERMHAGASAATGYIGDESDGGLIDWGTVVE